MSKSPTSIPKPPIEPKPSVFRDIYAEINRLRVDATLSQTDVAREIHEQTIMLRQLDNQLMAFRNEHQDLIQSLQNTIWAALAVALAAAGVISFCFAYWAR